MPESKTKEDESMNDKITMTLSELENYINSKSNNRLVYTHENNDISGIQLQIIFNAVTASPYTNRLVFHDTAKGHMTETNSNYLYITCIDKVTVEHIFSGCDAITITSNDGTHEREYVILYDYDNR